MKKQKNNNVVFPQKKDELMNMILHVPFQFKTTESMDDITKRLDTVFTNQRNKTLEAIAKILGLKINWENN